MQNNICMEFSSTITHKKISFLYSQENNAEFSI